MFTPLAAPLPDFPFSELCVCCCAFDLPREDPRLMLGMGLGMPPLPRLFGLVLLPGKRLWEGDVGERRASMLLGRADRFRG